MSTIDQQFVEYIVKSLVGKPDEVKVERRIDERGVLLELTVDPEDLGRVIGKRGSTAQSIRTLLRALGTKNDARYNLKIVDNGAPAPARDDSAKKNEDDQSDDSTSSKKSDKPARGKKDSAKPADDNTSDDSAKSDVDELDMTDEEELPEATGKESHDDVISRTRKELADLDDLDV